MTTANFLRTILLLLLTLLFGSPAVAQQRKNLLPGEVRQPRKPPAGAPWETVEGTPAENPNRTEAIKEFSPSIKPSETSATDEVPAEVPLELTDAEKRRVEHTVNLDKLKKILS